MAFLSALKQQTNVSNASIADLKLNVSYPVATMKEVNTKFGTSITCTLRDPDTDGVINVFLPKSISLSAEEIVAYNSGNVPAVSLIYKGKNRGRFNIDFE